MSKNNSEWRKEKRLFRKNLGSDGAVYHAYLKGQDKGYRQKPYRNPFPNGRRNEEYQRGYETAIEYPEGLIQ